jgi:hypothetical protein
MISKIITGDSRLAEVVAEDTRESFSLLQSTVDILNQDADLDSLLRVLPRTEFKRVFFAAAEMALAEAYAKSEEMHERFETDDEYRDGFLARAYNHCVERRVA